MSMTQGQHAAEADRQWRQQLAHEEAQELAEGERQCREQPVYARRVGAA